MLVSFEPKFVFLEMPRTGSRSIGRALRSVSQDFVQLNHHNMCVPPAYVGEFFIFLFVRNPYSREVSHYLYRRSNTRNNMHRHCRRWTFKEYLQWATNPDAEPKAPHDLTQTGHMDVAGSVDRVLRFEDLPHAFYELPFVDDTVKLPHVNGTEASDTWRDYYDEEAAAMVYSWARSDFEGLGYDGDSWRRSHQPDPVHA